MAYCYLEKKDWENVITYCNKVLEIKKDDTKAIYRRCKAYIAMGIKAVNLIIPNLYKFNLDR